MAQPEKTILQLTQKDFGDWLELYGRRLYQGLRDDLAGDTRRQDARWQSLNARVGELATTLAARIEQRDERMAADLRAMAEALHALKHELRAQRAAHRDPFGVFAALLRDLLPEAVRLSHAIWPPRAVDIYLRETWKLSEPEVRAYKTVWRDAKLIAVERENFARKFTVRRGVVAYMFAVPTAAYDLFRVDLPAPAAGACEDAPPSVPVTAERDAIATLPPPRRAVA